jgi:hypothetical protein
MDLSAKMTVAKLTPPGYFNLASDAPATHKAFITWWNAILAERTAQANALKTLILTPWLVTHLDAPRTPWLDYLLKQYGFGFFGGTNNQAAALYKLVSSGWNHSTIKNIILVVQTLCLAPFSWFDSTLAPVLIVGTLLPSIIDTGFVIYSTSAAPPATPAPTAYAARAWTVPAGWTNAASSATYYSRGYISGATLVWCAPRPVSDFANPPAYSLRIPVAVAAAGSICIVQNDETGDRVPMYYLDEEGNVAAMDYLDEASAHHAMYFSDNVGDYGAVYYSDGTAWRKSSYTNVDLGLVVPGADRPNPEAITVFSPNPASVTYAIDSAQPPPADGPTEGYGTFSTWADTTIMTNEITIQLHQLTGGLTALATLFELLRRIVPTGKTFVVDIDDVDFKITDKRQIL